MAINFFSEDVKKPVLKYNPVKQWIREVISSHGKKYGEINYIFCSDEYLLNVNKEHLEHDFYTDIITFDYSENDTVLGDLFISTERVKENALYMGTGDSELYRVMIHGILHLCGFSDHTEEEIETMRKLENEALIKLDRIFNELGLPSV